MVSMTRSARMNSTSCAVTRSGSASPPGSGVEPVIQSTTSHGLGYAVVGLADAEHLRHPHRQLRREPGQPLRLAEDPLLARHERRAHRELVAEAEDRVDRAG